MLTLALPIALVRLIDAGSWRTRIMYALAACLLVAAVFATYRKSALVAPAAVVLTLVYFRRSALLKLAPLGLVVLVIAMVLSPGALSSITDQFTRSDATAVGTVSDRASDYDAIRPDVWSHLALGRGWGSYNHESYRILDSEILHRTIETGVLGLVAFLLIPLVVLASARRADRLPRSDGSLRRAGRRGDRGRVLRVRPDVRRTLLSACAVCLSVHDRTRCGCDHRAARGEDGAHEAPPRAQSAGPIRAIRLADPRKSSLVPMR